MKDAQGHGSNSNRADFAHNKIALAQSAQFSRAGARPTRAPMTTNDHVNDLRSRLQSAQGPGHAAALWQGIKNALR